MASFLNCLLLEIFIRLRLSLYFNDRFGKADMLDVKMTLVLMVLYFIGVFLLHPAYCLVYPGFMDVTIVNSNMTITSYNSYREKIQISVIFCPYLGKARNLHIKSTSLNHWKLGKWWNNGTIWSWSMVYYTGSLSVMVKR